MKNKKGAIILMGGFVLSVMIAVFFANAASRVFPQVAFPASFTVLLAAIAAPQFVIGLSNSIIAKNLLPEFYKQFKYWLFLILLALLALVALLIMLNPKSGNTPFFFSHTLLFLMVFNIFYGFLTKHWKSSIKEMM